MASNDPEKFTLETLHVAGSPLEMGRAQGEALRERIVRFVDMRFEAMRGYFAERGRPNDWTLVADSGRASRPIFHEWDAQGHAEMLGIAEGAGIEVDQLFTATNMTDMRDTILLADASGEPLQRMVDEGCSSLMVPASRNTDGFALAAQTWDLNPPDIEYVVAIHRTPSDGLRTWAVTCTGCLTLMGINENGVSVGTTNIKTYGSKPGVGYLSILHRGVRSKTAAEAMKMIKTAPHAGAHTYWVADDTEQAEFEASPNGQFVRPLNDEPIYRTNHCLREEHIAIQGEVVGESSIARLKRLGQLLEGMTNATALRDVFADRSDGKQSINRYAEDEMGTATNAVFIAEPAKKRAFACRGPADRGEWIELSFD